MPHEIELLGIIAEMCGKVELSGNRVTQVKLREVGTRTAVYHLKLTLRINIQKALRSPAVKIL